MKYLILLLPFMLFGCSQQGGVSDISFGSGGVFLGMNEGDEDARIDAKVIGSEILGNQIDDGIGGSYTANNLFLKVTLEAKNNGKIPFSLNSGVGMTEGMIYVENENGVRYNVDPQVILFGSGDTMGYAINPGEVREKSYYFDANISDLTMSKIVFTRRNLSFKLQ